MNHSTPGLPVHHQLPEFTQTHAHQVGDAISHLILCRPLLLLPPIPPSTRVFSNESTFCMRWPKYWSFSFSISKEGPDFSLGNNQWCRTSFCIPVGHLYVFFEGMSVFSHTTLNMPDLIWRNVCSGLLSIFFIGSFKIFIVVELYEFFCIFWKLIPCWSLHLQMFFPIL